MSRLGVICKEPNSKCDLCGKIDECRPYGPNGESVCFECGMKDEGAAAKAFAMRVLGLTKEEAERVTTRIEQDRKYLAETKDRRKTN